MRHPFFHACSATVQAVTYVEARLRWSFRTSRRHTTDELAHDLRKRVGRWVGKSPGPHPPGEVVVRNEPFLMVLTGGRVWSHMIMSPSPAPLPPSSSSESSRSSIGYVRMAARPPKLASLFPLSWSLLSTLASPPSSLTLSTKAT